MPTAVEDKDAIRELLHRYCFCMDEGRFSELAALFSEDGEWIAPYRTAQGPAEIAAWLQQSVPPQPRRVHYVMNSIITFAVESGRKLTWRGYATFVASGIVGVVATFIDITNLHASTTAFSPRSPDEALSFGTDGAIQI